jgi:beta-N-acetylhexosaminidase
MGHIMQPAYSRRLCPGIKDEDIMPATLAPELINGLLREKLGFNGLIVTDATTMAGFAIPMSRSQAVPFTIAAGCDVFLFTKNVDEDYQYMTEGVENGTITPERLDEAVMRILALKAALRLPEKKADGSIFVDPEEARKIVGCKEHKEMELACAEKSVTLVKDTEKLLPISADKHKRILIYPILSGESAFGGGNEDVQGIMKEALEQEGFLVDVFQPSQGFEGMQRKYQDMVDHYDLMLYIGNMATKSNQTTVRIEWAQPMGADCPIYLSVIPTIFVSFANPYHLLDVPRIRTFINAYKFKVANVNAVIDKLLGRSPFEGKTPVDPFCGRWDAKL